MQKVFETIAFKPLNVLDNSSKLYYIFKVNYQIFFAKQLFTTSQRSCIRYVLLFVVLLIYDEIEIALVRKDGIICERNFIYTKLSKPLELVSFLFGDENTIINNLLNVKKLSVFVTYVTTEFYSFGNKTFGFLDF